RSSPVTKISSALPAGEGNGLAAIAHALVAEPRQVHVVVALLDCSKITENTDSGERQPTARIRRIEVISGQDEQLAAKMMRRAMEARTGATVLPFDLEEDLRKVFRVDGNTGEILDDEQ